MNVKNIFYVRDQNINGYDDVFDRNQESYYGDPDGTKFMSFEDDNKNIKLFKKPSKINIPPRTQKDYDNFEEFNSPLMLKSKSKMKLENSDVSSYKVTSPIRMLSSNIRVSHPLKQKLLDTNHVFTDIKKNITNNKGRAILP